MSSSNEKMCTRKCMKPFLGSLICILSSGIMTVAKSIAKIVNINPITICCVQFITLVILALPRAACKIHSYEAILRKKDWWLLFLRGFIGSTNNIIIIYALQVIIDGNKTLHILLVKNSICTVLYIYTQLQKFNHTTFYFNSITTSSRILI